MRVRNDLAGVIEWPGLFCSLVIIALSSAVALQGQELRLFAPLAYTKTYAMIAGPTFLSIRSAVLSYM